MNLFVGKDIKQTKQNFHFACQIPKVSQSVRCLLLGSTQWLYTGLAGQSLFTLMWCTDSFTPLNFREAWVARTSKGPFLCSSSCCSASCFFHIFGSTHYSTLKGCKGASRWGGDLWDTNSCTVFNGSSICYTCCLIFTSCNRNVSLSLFLGAKNCLPYRISSGLNPSPLLGANHI